MKYTIHIQISIQNFKLIGHLLFELCCPARKKKRYEKNAFKVFATEKLSLE